MLTTRSLINLSSATMFILLLAQSATAQIMGIGREHAELTRLRPADVHLANQTIMVQVSAVDPRAAGMTERMRKLITNRVIGVNKNVREVSKDPYYLVDCSITRYDYNERMEKKKLLVVKEQGLYKIISATLEGSYNVTRVSGNVPLFGGNQPVIYKKEFQDGVETAPVKDEVENELLRTLIAAMLAKLTNTEEKIKVRLMGKGELSRFARLAQAGQWAEYVESLKALPEQKADEKGESGFEGDRHYNISIAHEARFYETMWKDYKRAEQYFDLADTALRKARQYDSRESEYIKAQARLSQGKKYFELIKERFPKFYESETAQSGGGQRGGADSNTKTVEPGPPAKSSPSEPGAMTNKDVIDMVNAGVAERLIIDQINESKIKQFDVSAKGIIQLTTAGVNEKIIDTIKRATRQTAPRQTAPPQRTRRKGA